MEEKKLTDEEIVKAMEICANWNSMFNCKDCPIGLDTCCENQNGFAKYALDFIHRLQAENADLREERQNMSDVIFELEHEKMVLQSADAEQKAEIERLEKVQAELQEYNEKNYNEAKDLRRKTAELQKQVEKLKEENEYLDMVAKQALTDYQNTQVQVDELTDKLGTVLSGIKMDELLVAKGIEQAVKDTAKEILDDFDKHCVYSKDYTDFMRKEYGLEVE